MAFNQNDLLEPATLRMSVLRRSAGTETLKRNTSGQQERRYTTHQQTDHSATLRMGMIRRSTGTEKLKRRIPRQQEQLQSTKEQLPLQKERTPVFGSWSSPTTANSCSSSSSRRASPEPQ
mmetsp:Transcript_5336/g.10960  ORF Transcript_5336/g.10960 Transcript_5336/m.10960 type:complete len:120 (-) Transcript_5336:245-604(-)|eukprot:CAMPEP_0168816304 /NCGR_PEP_ID=MMETSP0726-20121227/6653_1 /TAXON_ID=265536 /ORGANISM="Amphiprora sp., Strain CCMP467" /LENGTH=119 /DNA_ID=CAMNT_0008868557 /DNA_START=148 /DNA_END=507 /DNA_ORIENTATION=+